MGHCHVADKSFKVGWRKIRRWLIKTRFFMPLRNRLPIVLADCFLFLCFCKSRTFGVTPLHLVFSRRGNDETTSLSHTRNRNCSNRKEGGGPLKRKPWGGRQCFIESRWVIFGLPSQKNVTKSRLEGRDKLIAKKRLFLTSHVRGMEKE